MNKLKVLWYWQTMGPYHFARMDALAELAEIDLVVVECTSLDDHGWVRDTHSRFELITLAREELSREVLENTRRALADALAKHRPDIIVAPGYAQPECLGPILAYRNAIPSTLVVLWSESTEKDALRIGLKERLKTLLLPVFDGALAAGKPHAEYLNRLRMPARDIQVVGNCVDNDYFSRTAKELRAQPSAARELGLPAGNYFLYVGRMIAVKNLPTLIRAYATYRRLASADAWDLVIVGSGPDEPALRNLVETEKIQGVHWAGVRQVEELPVFYAHAKCFVLPSTSEPWGLVVNEAMASGLPVLASDRCGCAPDLIRDGINGFLFDPHNESRLTELLLKISGDGGLLNHFGSNSEQIISNYTPALFARRAAAHLTSLYQRKTVEASRKPVRRLIAENAYALFGVSLSISRFAPPRNRARAS